MKLDSLLLCNVAFKDEHNRYCIIGIFDTILGPKLPIQHGGFTIFARLAEITPKNGIRFSLDFFGPDGKPLGAMSGQFDCETEIADLAMPMTGISMPSEGFYTIKFSIDGTELGYVKLRAKVREEVAAAVEAGQ